MQKTAEKWNLKRDIQFNSRVNSLDWQEEVGKWKVKVRKNGQEEREELFDVVVSAQGFLRYHLLSCSIVVQSPQTDFLHSQWKWPTIPGIHDFKGHKAHSAEWDHDYDYRNKRIAVIGNGSSGIQILPQLAKLNGTQLVSFQRGPTYITQSLGEVLAGGEANPDPDDEMTNGSNGKVGVDMEDVGESDDEIGSNFNPRYTRADKRRFQDKEKHRAYRKMLQQGMNKGFRIVGSLSDSYEPSPSLTNSLYTV